MSTYKRLCLLLCSLFMCCVGFLSVSSRVYAYTAEDGFYPVYSDHSVFSFAYVDGTNLSYNLTCNDGRYFIGNSGVDNVKELSWFQGWGGSEEWTFPFNPDLYDYYILGALTSPYSQQSESTFKPGFLELWYYDFSKSELEDYELSEIYIYDLDTKNYSGFGFSAKVDFVSAGNCALHRIDMENDKDGFGSKPPNLVFELGILAVEKGQNETAVMSQILNQLQNMENSLTDSIGSAADQVTDAIENQYGMIPGETFGVQDLTSQVEEKLGVLSFGADTLNNFLGLFQASNAGSTVLTFPGFTIDVQGESYQVWNDMQFDLAFLEENFGVLIIAVRTVTVLCVRLAVLGYLVKAYEHLVNNKG